MGNKKLLTDEQKFKLNQEYLSYLEKCSQENSSAKWEDFHLLLITKYEDLSFLDVKQLNNKIIDYRKIHGSQQWPTFTNYKKTKTDLLFHKLFKRSEDSFLLAIEIYNRINQNSKVEAFCILIINAWELLLKGYLIKISGETEIFYKDYPDRTITISDALKKVIQNENDLTRKNIEKLIKLRDMAVHLLIPEIQPSLSRLFQASIFNFFNYYNKLTEKKLNTNDNRGLISFVIDSQDITGDILREEYSVKTKEITEDFLSRLSAEENIYKNPEFIIPIEYKLVLTKNQKDGDYTISSTKDNNIFIQVPKDSDKTHPYLSTDVIKAVNKELTTSKLMPINQYSFQAIVNKEKVKKDKTNKYYHFIEKPKAHKYSLEFVELVIKKCKEDGYIDKCCSDYKIFRRKNRSI